MKKEFIIFDADETGLVDAEKEKFVLKVCKLGTDFYKVVLFTATNNYNMAIYDSRTKAKAEIIRFYREYRQFKTTENPRFNAFKFDVQEDITPLQVINSIVDLELELEGERND